MSRLLALALNTFREAVRDRILYSILFFAAGVILLSLALKHVTVGDQDKVIRSIGQGAIALFGSIIAMFLGVSLVYKELERKTVYTILSKPIPRWMFILGKYAGLMLTLAVEVGFLLLVYTLQVSVQQHFPPTIVFVSVGLLMVELGLLCAWSTLFSTYSSPTTATFFTMAVFVIGHLVDDIWLFGSQAESPVVQQISRLLYWVLPNLEMFNIRDLAVHERPVPWERIPATVAYGLGYTAAVLAAAIAVFQRRDIK
jgi:ABC-type transport system involved in multi-copper enzyme maturation permease subunit